MALPIVRALYDVAYAITSAATITSGFTVAMPMVERGEITDVYLCPIDGSAITTGSATLSINVENGLATATATLAAPSGAGFAAQSTGSLSPRLFVTDGDVVKMVLSTGLVNGQNGVVTIEVRQRTV